MQLHRPKWLLRLKKKKKNLNFADTFAVADSYNLNHKNNNITCDLIYLST